MLGPKLLSGWAGPWCLWVGIVGFTIFFSLEVVVEGCDWNCFCGIQGVGKVVISEWKYVCSLTVS